VTTLGCALKANRDAVIYRSTVFAENRDACGTLPSEFGDCPQAEFAPCAETPPPFAPATITFGAVGSGGGGKVQKPSGSTSSFIVTALVGYF
jgi:hypothetical protein